jgi:hypothetical protein
MSRNASGVYSLPSAHNPVVALTTIHVDWANTTLADIGVELTNSLDRSGRGAMQAPLQLPDGTAALPSLTFSADLNTGLYRVGADSIGLSTGGTVRLTIASALATLATPLTITGVLNVGNGAVGGPALSFGNDTDTGFYLASAGDVRLAIGGVDEVTFTASLMTVAAAMSVTGPTAATAAVRQNALALTNGDLTLSGVTNPNKDVAMSNVLSPKHIPKAWALFTVVGGGGAGNFTVTFTEGLNITSIARQSATAFRVTFATAFASANYIPIIQAEGVVTTKAVVVAGRTTTVVDFEIVTVATGANINLDASAVTWIVDLVVHGPQ